MYKTAWVNNLVFDELYILRATTLDILPFWDCRGKKHTGRNTCWNSAKATKNISLVIHVAIKKLLWNANSISTFFRFLISFNKLLILKPNLRILPRFFFTWKRVTIRSDIVFFKFLCSSCTTVQVLLVFFTGTSFGYNIFLRILDCICCDNSKNTTIS